MDALEEQVGLLLGRDNTAAHEALKALVRTSGESDAVYPYMDRFYEMLRDESSYVRTRGLTLIAHNARWDRDGRVDALLPAFLAHVADPKPITARQCVKLLPLLAEHKPALRADIVAALERADPLIYADSMQPLLCRDIQEALAAIRRMG